MKRSDNRITCTTALITRTKVENRCVLNGSDCYQVENTKPLCRGGKVSRMKFVRPHRVILENQVKEKSEPWKEDKPRLNVYTARMEEDPFNGPYLLYPIDS